MSDKEEEKKVAPAKAEPVAKAAEPAKPADLLKHLSALKEEAMKTAGHKGHNPNHWLLENGVTAALDKLKMGLEVANTKELMALSVSDVNTKINPSVFLGVK